jgi:hypothetical protein
MKNYGQAAEERRFEAAIRAAVSGELSQMIQLTNGDADEIRGMLDAKLDGIPYVLGTNTYTGISVGVPNKLKAGI